METLAFKSTWKHAVLEYRIKELDPNQDLSRSGITERSIEAAKWVKDWKPVRERLMQLERNEHVTTPVAMQAKIGEKNSEDVIIIRNKILKDLNQYIERLQTPYFVTLIWQNYLMVLEQKRKSIDDINVVDENAIDIPKMYAIFSEITHTDKKCQELKDIRTILVKWKNK